MGVEKLLPANGSEAGSSKTTPPYHKIHLATRRISQFVLERLPLLGLTVLSLLTDSPTAFSQKLNNNSSNSGENTLINPDIPPSEKAYQSLTAYPHVETNKEPLNLTASEVFGNKILSREKASAQVEDLGVGQDYTRTYVDALGNRIEWRVLNGTDGIPPNNPDHSIDKIFVTVNDSEAIPFQFNETQFPPDTNRIAVEGHWMDTKLNITYVPLAIGRNSTGGGKAFPYIGIVLDAKNAFKSPVLDLSKQKLITDLPQGGTYGDSFKYFKVDSDNNGMFIKFGIQQSINPKENGDYMIRLDNGLPVGKPVKIESVVMSRRGFIPFLGNAYTGR